MKIMSRSPKCDHFFPSFEKCTYESLVKFAQLDQSIAQGYPILDFQSASVTLIIRPRSPKSNLIYFPSSNNVYICEFDQIHQLVQKIMHRNHFWTFQSATLTLKTRSRSPKYAILVPFSQQCIDASVVEMHPLFQKITQEDLILDISKFWCDLENKVKVT